MFLVKIEESKDIVTYSVMTSKGLIRKYIYIYTHTRICSYSNLRFKGVIVDKNEDENLL